MDTEELAHEEEITTNEESIDEGGKEKTKMMSEMTQDQFMSWTGRNTKEQMKKMFDETVMPIMEELKASRQIPDYEPPAGDMDMIYNNPEKFVESVIEKKRKKDENMTVAKVKQIDEAILGYADDPLYREIHSEMKGIATKKVGEGWPPEAAVIFAKTKAEKNYYKRQVSDDTGLEMLGGSGNLPKKKQKSLPPKLKEACARDIRDGIVKDEADYINSMSPKMREIYGL